MSKAFDKLIESVKKQSALKIGDGTQPSILWADVESPYVAFILGGGIPIGRMLRFRGPASAGKSALCNYLAAALQRECPRLTGNPDKNKIILVDFERTFESRFAKTIGVQTDGEHFIHLRPECIEEAAEILDPLVRTGEVAGIIWDSDGASPTRTQMNDEFGHATFGGSARATSEFLKKFNILCSDNQTTLLWVSQERVNMKPMARLPVATGGEAPNFYTSITNRITKVDDIKDGTGIVGIEMRVKNMKNKCSVPFREIPSLKLYFDGGFNSDEEYIYFFIELGYIQQKGAYFQFDYEGEHFSLQGRQKLMDWLYSHADTYSKWKQEVKQKLTHSVEELDQNNFAVDSETGEALNEADAEAAMKYAQETTGTSTKKTEDLAAEALTDGDGSEEA